MARQPLRRRHPSPMGFRLSLRRVPITITRQIADGSKGNIRAALADLEMWMG